jgi:hypothetical protein
MRPTQRETVTPCASLLVFGPYLLPSHSIIFTGAHLFTPCAVITLRTDAALPHPGNHSLPQQGSGWSAAAQRHNGASATLGGSTSNLLIARIVQIARTPCVVWWWWWCGAMWAVLCRPVAPPPLLSSLCCSASPRGVNHTSHPRYAACSTDAISAFWIMVGS